MSINSYDTVSKYDLNPNYTGKNLKINALKNRPSNTKDKFINDKSDKDGCDVEMKNEREEKWEKLNHVIKQE